MGARQQPEIGRAHAQRRRNALGGQRRAPGDAAGIDGRVALGRDEMAAHARAHAVGADRPAASISSTPSTRSVDAKGTRRALALEIAHARVGSDHEWRIALARRAAARLADRRGEKPGRRAPSGHARPKAQGGQNSRRRPAADIDGLRLQSDGAERGPSRAPSSTRPAFGAICSPAPTSSIPERARRERGLPRPGPATAPP